MSRGEPIQRVLAVLLALEQATQGRRAVDLAAQLQVSVRTIHRALSILERGGVPLEQRVEGRERRWNLSPLVRRHSTPFSPAEVLALLWAERLVSPGLRLTVLAHPLSSAMLKVRAALPAAAADRVLDLAGRELGRPEPHHDYRHRDVELTALRRAMHERRTVQLRYRSFGQRPLLRLVDPYALVHHLGALYVVAYCHRRRAQRTFLVDRIRSVLVTPASFQVPEDFDSARYFAGTLGVYRGRPTKVRLSFDAAMADLAGERIWHESQKLRTLLDGTVELTLKVAATPDLVATILSFGAHVRVLEPRSLAETIAREWFAAAGQSRASRQALGSDVRPTLSRVGRMLGSARTKAKPRRMARGARK